MKDSRVSLTICLVLASLAVTACSPYRPSDRRAAICNQLNSEMVFAGSTMNTRKANIQNANVPSLAHTYEKDSCDRR